MKIITKTKGVQLPPDDYFYVIGSNGANLSMRTDWVNAIIPVEEVDGLDKVVPYCEWKLPKIPANIFQQIATFFALVAKRYSTEVGVLIHYNFKTKEWAVTVPVQTVSAGHVDYVAYDRLPGFRNVGTMHSHVNMVAGHSGTDVADESEIDGLHITIGKVGQYPKLDMAAEVVIRGHRFPINPERVIVGLTSIGEEEEEEKSIGKGNNWWPNYSYRSWDACSHVMANPDFVKIPKAWWKKLTVKSWKNYWKKDEKEGGDNDDDYSEYSF